MLSVYRYLLHLCLQLKDQSALPYSLALNIQGIMLYVKALHDPQAQYSVSGNMYPCSTDIQLYSSIQIKE